MYAIGIDGVDFWIEAADQRPGLQKSDGVSTSSSSANGVTVVRMGQEVRWTSAADEVLAVEQRNIEHRSGLEKDLTLLTWQLNLRPAQGKADIELWGRHYFGLGMRFCEAMDEGGRFFSPAVQESEVVRGTERLVRAPWCAFTAKVDGKDVTVAMFDHPGNPRHPATWFTMNGPFAYMTATLDLKRAKLTVSQDAPLKARYGVAVWDGQIAESRVQRAYQRWLDINP
jgi:hypothetical protein